MHDLIPYVIASACASLWDGRSDLKNKIARSDGAVGRASRLPAETEVQAGFKNLLLRRQDAKFL